MCGIIAVYDPQTPARLDAQTLAARIDASLGYISHRGPDATGVWVSKDESCGEQLRVCHVLSPSDRPGLGHCRLAINDLTADGEQPLHSPDGQVHAVVNGEIYDYDNVRAHISSITDYPFKGGSDSELVVALYLLHGRSFLHHLRGEFSLVIYDERSNTFLAARDRYGIKPLFWTRQDGRILIAAEIKAFLGMGWKAEWDVGAIVDGGWGQDTRTIFKGVQKVSIGYLMSLYSTDTRSYGLVTISQSSQAESLRSDSTGMLNTQTRSVSSCWSESTLKQFQRALETRSEADMIAHTRTLLLEAVRLRLRADVPVGIYLSGGIDSSALAGMAAHLVKEEGLSMGKQDAEDEGKICCFSIGFDESSGFDESGESSLPTGKSRHTDIFRYLRTDRQIPRSQVHEEAYGRS